MLKKVPKKPSGRRALPFYWWRRYKTHKPLPSKYPLLQKIQNGDFKYSPFFQQAEWELHWMKDEQEEFIKNYQGREPELDYLYKEIELRARKRYNKLIEDAYKDENEKLEKIVTLFCKNFKIQKEEFKDLISKFDKNLESLYNYCKKYY